MTRDEFILANMGLAVMVAKRIDRWRGRKDTHY